MAPFSPLSTELYVKKKFLQTMILDYTQVYTDLHTKSLNNSNKVILRKRQKRHFWAH